MPSPFSNMSYEEAGAYIDKLSKNSLTIRDHIWRTVNELGSAKAALQTLSARGLISSIEKQWPEENELRNWKEEAARQDEKDEKNKNS